MTSRTAMVLRGSEEPQRATFLDLFFDLAFVFALSQLSHGLLAHLGGNGAFQTAVLLLAVWSVWGYTARIGDRYDPGRPRIQLLVIGSMFGAFVVAIAAPEAFGTRGLMFAGAYVAVQVGRPLFLMVITRGGEHRVESRRLFWFGVAALPWLAGAVVQGGARGVLWALAVIVDYTAPRLGWPAPGLGRARAEEFAITGEFLAERQRQFIIIALGELILVTGLTATSSPGAGREAAVVVAFATTVLLWRIYIYRAGQVLGPAVATAPEPFRVGLSALYAHPVMVAGLVAISVGNELVIRHPAGHIQPAWIAVILGGPALFLAGRAMLEYAVFSRVSWDRVIGVLVLAAVSPAMIFAPPLLAALAAAVVLAEVVIADTARARRDPDEPPSPRSGPARTASQAPSRPRDDELLAGNWIWASNLRRFIELVSSYAGYRFDHPERSTRVSAHQPAPVTPSFSYLTCSADLSAKGRDRMTDSRDIIASGTSTWSGDWHHGGGTLSTVEHDTVGNVPFGYASRFDGTAGASPEELFATAYAGCLNQALANTGIDITLHATVPVINEVQFSGLVNAAKTGCLISRLLNVQPTMTATLESP